MALVPASNRGVDPSANVDSVFGRTGVVVAADGDYYGVVAAAKTGAVAASRYAGATASGAPAAGTFAVGDFVVDQTGVVWVCTAAGTPGTWSNVSANTQTPGFEFAYAEVATAITAPDVVAANAATIVSAAAVTFNGTTRVKIEGHFPFVLTDSASGSLTAFLFDGAAVVSLIAFYNGPAIAGCRMGALKVERFLTPSAAAHTYSIRAVSTGGAGKLGGEAGTTTSLDPGFIRITKS